MISESHRAASNSSTAETHLESVSDEDFLLVCSVEPEGISADVPNSSRLSKPNIPPFLSLRSFYRSYQTELWKTLRIVELCQLLSNPPPEKLEQKTSETAAGL